MLTKIGNPKFSSGVFFSLLSFQSLAFALFLFSLTLNAMVVASWGYDEFGVYISLIELENIKFIDKYADYLARVGLFSDWFITFFCDFILPVFVVPIRWTYALGISPLYNLLIFNDVTWLFQKSILLAPHFITFLLGIYFIGRSLNLSKDGSKIAIMFIIFSMLSMTFTYWSLTLTSYSYHIFCFGLLVFIETQNFHKPARFLGHKSMGRSIVILFNYQYIPIIVFIGALELCRNPKKFLKTHCYREWILPAIVAIISFAFIGYRGLIFGKHTSPILSSLDAQSALKYDVGANTSGFFEALGFIAARIFDIGSYFFSEPEIGILRSNQFTLFNGHETIAFYAISLLVAIILWKSEVKTELKAILAKIFACYFVLYIIGALPFTPSRHALVLFLPAVLCLSIVTIWSLNKIFSSVPYWFLFPILILSFSFNQISYKPDNSSIDIDSFIAELDSKEVDQLILAPCDLEPLHHSRIRIQYNPIYRCGSEVVDEISDSSDVVAVFTRKKLTESYIMDEISRYSKKKWSKFAEIDGSLICKGSFVQNNKCASRVLIFELEI